MGERTRVRISIADQAIPVARTPNRRQASTDSVIIPADRTAGTGAPARRTYAQQAGRERTAETRFRSGVPWRRRTAQIADRMRKTAIRWNTATFTPDMASRCASPVLLQQRYHRVGERRGFPPSPAKGGTARRRSCRSAACTQSPVRRLARAKNASTLPSPGFPGKEHRPGGVREKGVPGPVHHGGPFPGYLPGIPGASGGMKPSRRAKDGRKGNRPVRVPDVQQDRPQPVRPLRPRDGHDRRLPRSRPSRCRSPAGPETFPSSTTSRLQVRTNGRRVDERDPPRRHRPAQAPPRRTRPRTRGTAGRRRNAEAARRKAETAPPAGPAARARKKPARYARSRRKRRPWPRKGWSMGGPSGKSRSAAESRDGRCPRTSTPRSGTSRSPSMVDRLRDSCPGLPAFARKHAPSGTVSLGALVPMRRGTDQACGSAPRTYSRGDAVYFAVRISEVARLEDLPLLKEDPREGSVR